MKEEELLTFDESFFLLLSCSVFTGLHATVHCQPSICLYDQEHGIGNCFVCWTIVTCLNIAGNSYVMFLCFCVRSMNFVVG